MLDGIRVLDLTMWAFCPAAGSVLAEWGADVIHIENAKAPDPMRLFGGGSIEPGKSHWMFKHYNRGKRAIALDLASDEGREVLYDLVSNCDVFLTSFLPATRKKLGFDIEQLRAINPNLIYAKGTGAGPLGPESERGGFDGASWWARGSLAATAMEVTNTDFPPAMLGHGDGMSGLVLAGGIVAALFKRERTGEVTVVDSSLFGTAAWFNAPAIIGETVDPANNTMGKYSAREKRHWSVGDYATADGRYVHLTFLGDRQDQWLDLCNLLERNDLAKDPRFLTSVERAVNTLALMDELDAQFATKTLNDWKPILNKAKGVWAPVQTVGEMVNEPQAQANRMIRMVTDEGGTQPIVMPPVMFNEDAGPGNPAPNFGQHTDEVLAEIAGFSADRITELRASGAIV